MSTTAVSARHARAVPGVLGVAVLCLSFAAIFFRKAGDSHPLVVSGTRLALAALVLAWPMVRGIRAGRLDARARQGAVLCGLLYGLHFGTWVTSLSMTSVASSVTLVTATPLLLALLSFATGRDRPERRHWISIGLALVGLSLIGWTDLSLSTDALIGDGLALAGAAAMALYLLVVRSLGDDLDTLAFQGLSTAVGAASLLGAAALVGVPLTFASSDSLFWTAMAALIPHLIGHTALAWSLRHATPTAVGIATVGEPVGATLLAWLWLGDEVGLLVLVGCAITLSAVLLTVRRRAAPRDVLAP